MNNLIFKFKTLKNSPLPFYRLIFLIIGRIFLKIIFVLGSLIDFLFFDKINKIKPVFLIGHPRSGTTFLHRFLLEVNPKYRGMYLWEMLVPYLSLRIIFKPIIKLIAEKSKKKLYDTRIHTTGLFKAETDDVALFFKSFEGLFFWLYFGAFKKYDNITSLENELNLISNIKKTLENLNILHSKNLTEKIHQGKIMFSKSFSLILDIEKLISSFPSAKVILLLRDPVEVIPSSMSLTRNVLQNLYDFDKLDDDIKNNYYNNLYSASIIFYKSLHNTIQKAKNNADSILLIQYKNLKTDFSNEFNRLIDFLEINLSDEFRKKIISQESKQKEYKSQHKYSLEEFGLSEQKIITDFNFIYENYNV
ncbi:MAG: sulfotransferase [Bacteroidales bacterium]|nr:sulfotransferase [Bacteroidales bacterium]